jgi:hypothetical protein
LEQCRAQLPQEGVNPAIQRLSIEVESTRDIGEGERFEIPQP